MDLLYLLLRNFVFFRGVSYQVSRECPLREGPLYTQHITCQNMIMVL